MLLLDRLARIRSQPASMLDIGCGTGHLLRLALRFFPGTPMTGVNPAPWALPQAAANARHARFVHGGPHALPATTGLCGRGDLLATCPIRPVGA